jgi:hypothetical protein
MDPLMRDAAQARLADGQREHLEKLKGAPARIGRPLAPVHARASSCADADD